MAQQIVIDIVAETKKLTEGFNEIDKEVKNVSGKLKGLTSAAATAASAFVLKKGVTFLKQGIEEAREAAQTMRAATTTFGAGSKALEQITKDAEKFAKELAVDNDELIQLGTQLGSRLPDDVKASSVELVKIFKDVEAFTGGAVSAEAASAKLAKAFADGELKASELQKIFPGLEQATYDQAEALSKAGKNQDALNLLVDAGAKKYDDAASKNVTASQRFDKALADLKETIGAKLLDPLEKLVGFATKLIDAFSALPEPLQNFSLGLLALVGIGGPLIGFVANLQASLVQLGLLPAASGAAATGLNLVKVALAGLGIGLVIAAIVLLIQHWDDVTKVVKDVYEAVKKWIGDMVEKAKDLLKDAIDWIEKNWPTILAVLTGPFGLFVKWLVDNKDDIVKKLKDIWDGLKDFLDKAKPYILDALLGPFDEFATWLLKYKDDIIQKFKDIWDTIKTDTEERVKKIIGTVVYWWDALKEWIKDLFSDKAESLFGIMKKGWNNISDFLSDIATIIFTTLTTKWLDIFTKVIYYVDKIKDGVVEKFNELKDKAIEKFNELKTAASGIWDKIAGFISDVATKIRTKLGEVYNDMIEVGKDIARGIIDGLLNIRGWFVDKLTKWVNDNIPDVIRKVLQISSPSKVMMQVGANIAEGLYMGMGVANKPGITLPQINVGGAGAGAPINITINAGLGTDPYALGREVSNAVKKYGRISRNAI